MKEHCECHELKANFDANLSQSCVVCIKTHDVTGFVIDRDSRNNENDLVRQVFALLSKRVQVECTQANSTISANRPRSWNCVRVLTSRHEDEIWMTQVKVFLSPVPLNVGPSVESRGLDSPLGAVLFTVARQHFQSKMSRWKNCTRKVTFQNVTVHTIVVVVDDQPVLT